MTIAWQVLSKNIFLVSADGSKPILYAPLQGVVMEVNQKYVDRFREVLQGNTSAATVLGLEPSVVERFIQTPPEAVRLLNPQWPSTFEPTSVTVFLTHKCTLRCAYCYCHGGEGIDMPWPVFERAARFTLDNARRLKHDFHLGFHGGDVGACWPLFQRCVGFVEQVCAEAGVKCVMSIGTNGFYTDDQARYVAQHINNATVSVDGTPAIHDEYRATASGQPSLSRILGSIKIFEANKMAYSVRMTVTGKSLPLLPECVEFICQNTQAGTIRAEPLYSRGRATSTNMAAFTPDQFVQAFRVARAVAKTHQRLLSYSGARLGGVFGSFCSYPAPTFGVTPEGNLTCCYEVLHPDDPLRDPFFYGQMPPDGSCVTVDKQRVATLRALAQQRREACAHCFCVYACAGDCATKVQDGALPANETPARCHITRALVYDMLWAVLSGENPLQPAIANSEDARPRTASSCVDCAKAPPGQGPAP